MTEKAFEYIRSLNLKGDTQHAQLVSLSRKRKICRLEKMIAKIILLNLDDEVSVWSSRYFTTRDKNKNKEIRYILSQSGVLIERHSKKKGFSVYRISKQFLNIFLAGTEDRKKILNLISSGQRQNQLLARQLIKALE